MTDDELLQKFEACTLPFAEWTHRAHVRVAYLYVTQHPFPDALARLRAGIQAYNRANAVPEGPMQGYNETTTCALAQIIAAVARAYAGTHPVANADAFYEMHPQLASKHVLRCFYSPARRMHPDAKVRFIEPDLAPLPSLASGPLP